MFNPNNQTKLIIAGLVVLCTLLLGSSIYFATRDNSQNSSISNSKSSSKIVEINPNELTPAQIPEGYPQKLTGLKRTYNEGVTFNLGKETKTDFTQKQDPKSTVSNSPSGYFSRITNNLGRFDSEDNDKFVVTNYQRTNTKVANSFVISNLIPTGMSKDSIPQNYSTINHIFRNPDYVQGTGLLANNLTESIKTTGVIIKSFNADGGWKMGNSIKENIIWYGSTKLLEKETVNKFIHGVAFYSKNLNEKGLMGTYLRDYDAEIDTKISNQVCTNITFTNNNFLCLNDYETLVNLNTGEEFGKYNQFIDTNDGYLYAKDVDNTMIYKVELNNPKNATKIYSVKENEVISHFSYTSQKELLVQITTSTPQPGILAPKVKARTIELKPDGSVLERPEFKDVRIFI
jgi:hypothetical protein